MYQSSKTYITVIISLVEETLVPLDPNRKAFRLIGGILVERTVGDVLPSVASNRENVRIDLFSTYKTFICY